MPMAERTANRMPAVESQWEWWSRVGGPAAAQSVEWQSAQGRGRAEKVTYSQMIFLSSCKTEALWDAASSRQAGGDIILKRLKWMVPCLRVFSLKSIITGARKKRFELGF